MQKWNSTQLRNRATHRSALSQEQESEPKKQIDQSMERSSCFGDLAFGGKFGAGSREAFVPDYQSSKSPSTTIRFRH